MKKSTVITLIAAVSMTLGVSAAERPERPTVTRPDANGTTTDEVVDRPERPTEVNRPVIERIDKPGLKDNVARNVRVIRSTHSEFDRIKEALKRLRENNRDLTEEQVQRIRERLLERAKELVARAKSAKERVKQLRPKLGDRNEILDSALDNRTQAQDARKDRQGGKER